MFDASLLGESRTELVARLDDAGTFTRWVQLAPPLSADGTVSSVADVFNALAASSDPARWDGLLGVLLQLAAVDGGDQGDAVLAVLHAVAGGAARLVRRGFEEGLVLGQLTIQIRTYLWRTRRRAVAANLLLDTEHALCREMNNARMQTRRRACPVTETPVDMRPYGDDPGPFDELVPDPAGDDLDLVDLLLWAERSGVVGARDLAMLLEYHYARQFSGAGHEHVARLFGVNLRTSKRRCTATLQALQAAAAQYLAA